MPKEPCIIAMGGGGVNATPYDASFDEYLLGLLDTDAPRICYVPTARGDQAADIVNFYTAFNHGPWRPSHLTLFTRTQNDLEAFVLGQDAIYVGGGNTANMLAVWRLHGLDTALEKAWRQGVTLAGWSAGGLIWYEGGTTNSFGANEPSIMADGLGFLPGSFCPHYDIQPKRPPLYRSLIASGQLPAGLAVDDSAAVRYQGTEIVEAVCWKQGTMARRVERVGDAAKETPIETRYIGPS